MITGDYIKALPWWVTWVALAALVTAAAGWGYVKGALSVQADWAAAAVKDSLTVETRFLGGFSPASDAAACSVVSLSGSAPRPTSNHH